MGPGLLAAGVLVTVETLDSTPTGSSDPEEGQIPKYQHSQLFRLLFYHRANSDTGLESGGVQCFTQVQNKSVVVSSNTAQGFESQTQKKALSFQIICTFNCFSMDGNPQNDF